MPSQEPRLAVDKRGQTPHDYVVGILVFIGTVVVVVGLLPTLTAPYQSGVDGDDIAQADRIAQQLVANLSTIETPNRLNSSQLGTVLELPEDNLSDRYGLPRGTNINITVNTLDGGERIKNATGTPLTSVQEYDRGSAASAARIVRLSNESSTCDPACRLVVRVW
jgi:hypothetical protein